MSLWYLYLVRNARNQLYTGITTDVARRFAEHQADGPKSARALRGKGPLHLAYQVIVGDHSTALKLEARIKRWSKARKEALITGTPLPTEMVALIDAASSASQDKSKEEPQA